MMGVSMDKIGGDVPSLAEVELRRILASEGFVNAKRLSRFLEYVVTASIEGREIKEALIGVEVYGREADYDPKTDSIVRAEASRLRAKLREFYDGPGKESGLRIHIPKGGYEPAFDKGTAAQPHPLRRGGCRGFRWRRLSW
jgi:hypothetical protein